jgi:hypothetical protein
MDRNETQVHAEAPKGRTPAPGNHNNSGKPDFCVFLYKHVISIHLLLWETFTVNGGYTVAV